MNTTLLILMILCLLLAGFFLKAEHEQKYVLAVIEQIQEFVFISLTILRFYKMRML